MTAPLARSFADIALDDSVSVEHEVTAEILDAFASVSGDGSPIHIDDEAARDAGFERRVAHGALLVAWASEIVGMRLPGARSLLVELKFEFLHPVLLGDKVSMEVRVTNLSHALQHVTLALSAKVAGKTVAKGRVGVMVR